MTFRIGKKVKYRGAYIAGSFKKNCVGFFAILAHSAILGSHCNRFSCKKSFWMFQLIKNILKKLYKTNYVIGNTVSNNQPISANVHFTYKRNFLVSIQNSIDGVKLHNKNNNLLYFWNRHGISFHMQCNVTPRGSFFKFDLLRSYYKI